MKIGYLLVGKNKLHVECFLKLSVDLSIVRPIVKTIGIGYEN